MISPHLARRTPHPLRMVVFIYAVAACGMTTFSDNPAELRLSSRSPLGTEADYASMVTVDIVWLSDMDFGEIVAGTANQIEYTDGSAAAFRADIFNLPDGQNVTISFTLPTQITNGGDSVPISFAATDAGWSYTNDAATATTFDPSGGVLIPKNGVIFSVYIWLGARATPAQASPAQSYTNTLTIDASTP